MIGEKHFGRVVFGALVLVCVAAILTPHSLASFSAGSPVQVEVDVYSGRPNPRWRLNSQQAEKFLKMVQALPKRGHESRLKEGLGYRGLKITMGELNQDSSKEIVISNGIVEARENGGSQQFTDHDRALERWLLQTGKEHLEDKLFEYLSKETSKSSET